jgi:hypothetical protein
VIAVEMDSWSCTAARENLLLNGVTDRVEVREERVGTALIPGEPPFDGLLANIESGILLPLLPSFARGVRPGGWLVLSGILQSEADGILEAAHAVGFLPIAEDREEEWWTGSFRRQAADSPGSGRGRSHREAVTPGDWSHLEMQFRMFGVAAVVQQCLGGPSCRPDLHQERIPLMMLSVVCAEAALSFVQLDHGIPPISGLSDASWNGVHDRTSLPPEPVLSGRHFKANPQVPGRPSQASFLAF